MFLGLTVTEEEAVGPVFWQPTVFSGFVCFEGGCVWERLWFAFFGLEFRISALP